jgi:hypothetical protein
MKTFSPPMPRRARNRWQALLCVLPAFLAPAAHAQGPGGPPPMREHRANEAKPLRLEPANRKPPGDNLVRIEVVGDKRVITSNGVADHLVGAFPNRGNPNRIQEQRYRFELPAHPEPAADITWLHRPAAEGRGAPNMPFGMALNGILFDPGTAEFWNGDRAAGWNYEALGGAVPLGLDEQHAHVQPNGAYHYHGLSHVVMDQLSLKATDHSPLIGWAADGFPIYALRGYRDVNDAAAGMKTLTSSYRLKQGDRPRPPRGPGGRYDGAFVQDYEYVAGSGDLDECNGRFGPTPEFPGGTYAYFLTMEWPVVPRAFRGTPIAMRAPGGPGGGPGGPGVPGFGPPPGGPGMGPPPEGESGRPKGRRRGPPPAF